MLLLHDAAGQTHRRDEGRGPEVEVGKQEESMKCSFLRQDLKSLAKFMTDMNYHACPGFNKAHSLARGPLPSFPAHSTWSHRAP